MLYDILVKRIGCIDFVWSSCWINNSFDFFVWLVSWSTSLGLQYLAITLLWFYKLTRLLISLAKVCLYLTYVYKCTIQHTVFRILIPKRTTWRLQYLEMRWVFLIYLITTKLENNNISIHIINTPEFCWQDFEGTTLWKHAANELIFSQEGVLLDI